MRAIFINAVDQKVEEIQIENELHAFYERIGCDMIQCIDVGESNLLVCDEEGRLRNWKVGFRWPGSEGIAGNALLVCVDKNDDFTDAKVPKILIELRKASRRQGWKPCTISCGIANAEHIY